MGVVSLREQAARVFELLDDERHLTALDLLEKVQKRLTDEESSSSFRTSKRSWRRSKETKRNNKEIEEVKLLLAEKASTIATLQKRCQLFREALHNVDATNDAWTLASAHFGIQTYYRREEDGSLSVKLEGELHDAPLFEQVCVLREFDLHCKWSPCCTASQTIRNLGKLDTVGWFCIGLPSFGIARDGCVRVIGCDHSIEEGKVIVTGHGVQDVPPGSTASTTSGDRHLVDDPVLDTLDIPPVPTKKGTGRMTIRTLQAVIEVTSPTSATTKLVANMDPNVSILPNCLLELAMKNIAGLVLLKMQGAARRVPHYPHTNPHARRMRQDPTFYKDWLLPKCQRLCESRGWTMTPVQYFDELPVERSEQRPIASSGPMYNTHQHPQTTPHPTMGQATTRTTDASFDGAESSTLTTGTSSGTAEESDTVVSEWSKDSSRMRHLLSKNPVANVWNERQRKTRALQMEQTALQTQRSCARLRARTLSSAEEARAAALQRAKVARSQCSQQQQQQHKWNTSLHHHSTPTRVVIMTFLMSAMIVSLYPALVLSVVGNNKPWPLSILSPDTEAILSIFLCAIPHFLLCDVALVYAFDGLELSAKAGATVHAYYQDTVRYCMLLVSLGAAAFSVVQAGTKYGMRQVLQRVAASESILASFLPVVTKTTTLSWTDDAYRTARSLFFYSSMGLVYCVVLFYLWLRTTKGKNNTSSDEIPKTITMKERPPPPLTSLSSDSLVPPQQ